MPIIEPDPQTLARLQRMETEDFGARPFNLRADEHTTRLPLVAANVIIQTNSFTAGQKVHIYDVYWGMNDNALVVGRFRRKHDFIFGVIPIRKLDNFRPEYVYHPVVLNKFRRTDKAINPGIFQRFFERPDLPAPPPTTYHFADDAPTAPAASWLARLWNGLRGSR
ncbi:hypothetical protein EJV47_05185 [Hymenobacter gummosus]|uniref:Uncharacterized protein n=1 Tax=Hymenobacter gummosus TaxID=1776032 RepID=A0A3S0HQP0_9BACT|nr:hypothetical protein [Hymenobacter gummosus]RTQ52410.1 hypothetical protein EJV47_05185 [Hymenobacter gummosus]